MKRPLLIAQICCLSLAGAQENRKPNASNDLAAPLRRFDRDRDGKLNDDELKLARQAHNRGGREVEPTANRWREVLERREREFTRQREKEFDANGDGKVDDGERKEMRAVWQRMATRFSELRDTITAKYDRNDDGELDEQERNASRAESDRLRREIEDQCVREWRAARAKPAAPAPGKSPGST